MTWLIDFFVCRRDVLRTFRERQSIFISPVTRFCITYPARVPVGIFFVFNKMEALVDPPEEAHPERAAFFGTTHHKMIPITPNDAERLLCVDARLTDKELDVLL